MADIFKKFGSIKEFYSYLDAGRTQSGFYESSKYGDKEFTLTNSYEEATNLLLYGDKELQDKIESMGVSKLRANMARYTMKRTQFASVVGFAPHVPNYIAGVPTSMIDSRNKHVKQTVVTVFYNCAVWHGVEATEIYNAVAKLCCALIKLEASGIRVNLYTGTLGTKESQYGAFAVKIKASGQPFDTLKMCYPLAHPSFNRRHKFRFIEVTEGFKKAWAYGYGSAVIDDNKTKEYLKSNGLDVDACFNYESISKMDEQQIINAITLNYK